MDNKEPQVPLQQGNMVVINVQPRSTTQTAGPGAWDLALMIRVLQLLGLRDLLTCELVCRKSVPLIVLCVLTNLC